MSLQIHSMEWVPALLIEHKETDKIFVRPNSPGGEWLQVLHIGPFDFAAARNSFESIELRL